jgi:hypothetical protein
MRARIQRVILATTLLLTPVRAFATQPCPEGTHVDPLVLWGAPAVVLVLGALACLGSAKVLRGQGWLRGGVVGLLAISTLMAAFMALGIASALGPCR